MKILEKDRITVYDFNIGLDMNEGVELHSLHCNSEFDSLFL